MTAKHYSSVIMKVPNIFLCPLHLLHAVMGLHIFSAGYAQLAPGDCLVTVDLQDKLPECEESAHFHQSSRADKFGALNAEGF